MTDKPLDYTKLGLRKQIAIRTLAEDRTKFWIKRDATGRALEKTGWIAWTGRFWELTGEGRAAFESAQPVADAPIKPPPGTSGRKTTQGRPLAIVSEQNAAASAPAADDYADFDESKYEPIDSFAFDLTENEAEIAANKEVAAASAPMQLRNQWQQGVLDTLRNDGTVERRNLPHISDSDLADLITRGLVEHKGFNGSCSYYALPEPPPAREAAELDAEEEHEARNEIIFEFEAGHTARARLLYRNLYPEYRHENDDYLDRTIRFMVDFQRRKKDTDELAELRQQLAASQEETRELQAALETERVCFTVLQGIAEDLLGALKDKWYKGFDRQRNIEILGKGLNRSIEAFKVRKAAAREEQGDGR